MINWPRSMMRRPAIARRGSDFDPAASVEDHRKALNGYWSGFGPILRGTEVSPVLISSMRGEWVIPDGAAARRVILYFHGGGFIAGSPEGHRPFVARLAQASGARILVPQYRLAPEHPYPAALRDAADAYRWLLSQGLLPQHVIFAGDGSGGGLALATLLALRNAGLPLPAAAVCFSPWADLTMSGWSMLKNSKSDDTLSWEILGVCARHYLRGTSPADPFASPIYGDYRGLPPLMIHAGSLEVLKDDASRIGERAAAASVNVNVEVYEGMPHFFQAIPDLSEAKVSLTRSASFIKARTPDMMIRRAAQ
ncbi:MAG TPA: alpha/beta hydrolase [Alphaproteobacteria bacterium]|nr:alpha/beta hydrolase [Alphaproteobacteria bacterium]HAJ46927.1 alpha/beta hydrolase [Alphaproteobacteria bacterium]